MQPTSIAVVGARGKTGRAVTAALVGRGALPRPIGRAELRDPVEAVRGCDAIYLIAPNLHPDEPAFVADILAAASRAEVPRLVYHSVVSPYAPSMPHHLGKAVSEDLIRRSGLSWTILQPSCYLQNLVPALLSTAPSICVPYATTQPFSFVDLLDVAEAAAEVTISQQQPHHGTHHGATYELGGAEHTTLQELARVAEEILGTAVATQRIDPEAWSAAQLLAADEDRLDDRQRSWLRAMFTYYDQRGLLCGSVPLTALLGRTPTTVETTLRRELRS